MKKNVSFVVALFGFLILLFSVICALFVIPLIETEYFVEGNLQNGSLILKKFIKPSASRKLRFYFFNVLNPEEVLNGAIPIIEEIGPFIYNQYVTRRISKIDQNTNKIEFFKKTIYKFNFEQSGSLTDTDNVTIINIPFIGFLLTMEGTIKKGLLDLNTLLSQAWPENKNILFLKTRVKDILFDGIEISCKNQQELICMQINMTKPTQQLKSSGNKVSFSLFNHINGTEIGPLEIYTGNANTVRGAIVSFKNRKRLNIWKSKGQCNSVQGLNLQLIPPLPHPIKRLYTFFPEFCRSFFFVFDALENINGVPSYRYISNKEPFDNSRDNECFCIKSRARLRKSSMACNPKGTMDLTGCQNFSLILSYPHFYLGNPDLENYAEGLKIGKKLHESVLYVEPRSGTVLKSAIRFQYNIKLKKFENLIDLVQNVSEGIFPILWSEDVLLNLVLELNHDITDYFLLKVYYMNILRIGKYTLLMFGVLTMLFSVVLKAHQLKDESNNSKNIQQNVNLFPQLKNKNLSDRFMKNKESKLY